MVAVYRVLRDSFTDDKADTYSAEFICYKRKDKQPGRETLPLLPYSQKLTTFPQTKRTLKRHSVFTLSTSSALWRGAISRHVARCGLTYVS